MTSSAAYTSDGNRLSTTTDAAGNVTTYSYNANTNVLEWVQYPNGSGTKTTYTYDTMYRLATASASTGTQTLSASYTYENDLLTKLTTGSTTYNFAYGNFGLRSSIKVGSTTLATYTYTSRNNYLQTLAYGNSDSVQYTYDSLGRVTKETYEDGDTVTYAYDNDGALATVTDSATGRKTTYYYDFTNRLMKYVEQGSGYSHSVGYTYDTLNNLTQLVETINGTERTTAYAYDDDNRVTSVTNGLSSKSYTYDGYGRVSSRGTKHNGSTIATDTITYRTVNSKVTGQVSKLVNKAGTFEYTYDANGNIVSVTFGGKTTKYTYDNQNQLTREDNQAANKTWVWTYDDAGNILSKKEYAYTTGTLGSVLSTVSYGYGNSNWGDLLTSWGGKTISSDAIGNMTSDGTWSYSWEHGRELASMTSGGTTWTFTYDANGMRTARTNGSTAYSYVYNGGQLSQMTVAGNTLNFTYDASGSPMSVTYGGATYYYITNLQGDVVAILNSSGTSVVTYTYDAWGKLLTTSGTMASTLGVHNPLRYRGYVYDTESGLYYLQSRYYNPEIGRFINSDVLAATGQGLLGNNMFAYCGNNPVTRNDVGGNWWDTILDVASLVLSIYDVVQNPDDIGAWVGLVLDVVDVVVPVVSGLGEAADAVNATRKITEAATDANKAAKKVHGNSLDYPGINYGYILSDKTTGEVVKFGESIDPAHRYTKKYLNGANPIGNPLEMTVVISGTKRDVHNWQHMQIVDYYEVVGELPALNKSMW